MYNFISYINYIMLILHLDRHIYIFHITIITGLMTFFINIKLLTLFI